MNNDKKVIWLSIGLFVFILIADRITKYLAVRYLQVKSIHIMPWIDLVYVTNKGIVFGLFSDTKFNLLFLSIASLLIISILMIYWFKPIPYPIIAMILAGGVGNLIDRIQYGHVVDFIKIHQFYVFNVADASITISIILFLWFYLFKANGKNTV
ncbi:signal peptidase II [bacterium]|nr:signal peptidase II [bacterium]